MEDKNKEAIYKEEEEENEAEVTKEEEEEEPTTTTSDEVQAEEEPFYQPTDIAFKSMVFDTRFHPTRNILAAGLVSGYVKLFKYGDEPDEDEEVSVPSLLHSLKVHNPKACRTLFFSPDGNSLYTGGTDGNINQIDVETGSIVNQYQSAHPTAINTIHIRSDDRYSTLFSGDEDGRIRVWDIRSGNKKPVHDFHKHHDYISSFLTHPSKPTILVAGSGDGCLSGWNLRKGDVDGISENLNDEILSLALLPDGERLLCGTQDGVINMFEWGAWGEPTGTYHGHPSSISSIVVIDNNSIFTGSSDGLIRVVQVAPHKIYGVLGDCGDLPVEELRVSHDNALLASVSHDQAVRFWDVREYYVDEMEQDSDEEDEEEEEEEEKYDDSDSDNDNDVKELDKKRSKLSDSVIEDDNSDSDNDSDDDSNDSDSDDSSNNDSDDSNSDSDEDKFKKKNNNKNKQQQQQQQKQSYKNKKGGKRNNKRNNNTGNKRKKGGFFGGL